MMQLGRVETNIPPEVAPLVLSDRFARLAEESRRAGFGVAAEHLAYLSVLIHDHPDSLIHTNGSADIAWGSRIDGDNSLGNNAALQERARVPERQTEGGCITSTLLKPPGLGRCFVSPLRQTILDLLLDATFASARGARPLLRPLWTTEALQRAHNLVDLVAELERLAPLGTNSGPEAAMECSLAVELAVAFHSLNTKDEQEILPCSNALRTTTRNLVELFGPLMGCASVQTSIERLALPAYKRRALVLAACTLIMDVLREGSAGCCSGRILVMLHRTERGQARFSVFDDGLGVEGERQPQSLGVVNDLASLLESEVIYVPTSGGGLLAEMTFPISHSCNSRITQI